MMVKREGSRKKHRGGLKRGRDYAVLLFFPLPLCRFCFSLRSLFRATLSSGGTEYRGGGGRGGHQDPDIRGGGLKTNSVWSKNKGGHGPPGSSPGSATAIGTSVKGYGY